MCELWSVIFSSFWTFLGTLILVVAIFRGLLRLIVIPFAISRGYKIKMD